VSKAPSVKAVQIKIFGVGIVVFHVFKTHLKAAAGKTCLSVFFKKTGTDHSGVTGFFWLLVRQSLLLRVCRDSAVGTSPFVFVSEQAAGVSALGKNSRGLNGCSGWQGRQCIRLPRHRVALAVATSRSK